MPRNVWKPKLTWAHLRRLKLLLTRSLDLYTIRSTSGKSPTGKDFNGDLSLSTVYPKPGYQNAPKFCENTDKAMGTYAFNVPKRLTPGKYTFLWLWAFNSDKNLYSSCFEVEVVRNKAARDRMLKVCSFFLSRNLSLPLLHTF